jgi:hypothetical protein
MIWPELPVIKVKDSITCLALPAKEMILICFWREPKGEINNIGKHKNRCAQSHSFAGES